MESYSPFSLDETRDTQEQMRTDLDYLAPRFKHMLEVTENICRVEIAVIVNE